jgi:hypothetical protein
VGVRCKSFVLNIFRIGERGALVLCDWARFIAFLSCETVEFIAPERLSLLLLFVFVVVVVVVTVELD